MFLSKSCVYGIRSVLYLTLENHRRYIPIKEISAKLEISFHFLTKILQTLSRAGFINSFKGPNGGVMLAKSPQMISVLDIISILDGDTIFEQCILGLPGCEEKTPCPMHESWSEHRNRLKESFRQTNLELLAYKMREEGLRLYEIY